MPDAPDGKWARVREAQTPFCTLTPLGAPFAYYQGMAQEYMGRPAREAFARALRCSPYHKQSLNDLARCVYTDTHDADSAAALFREAIRISPSFSYAYFNLAQLYLMEGQPESAREVLLRLDLDGKEQRIRRLVWHYHSGETADYYYNHLVDAERQMRDQLLKSIK